MNNSFIEKTKLTIPHIDDKIVERDRIFSRLNKSLNGKILFLSASAGYGKTTAVASWIQYVDIKYLWFSLDEQDNEPIRLIHYLCRGIMELFPESIDCSIINSQDSSIIFERLYLHLQNIDEKVLIVLDDYHILKNQICIEYIVKLIKNKPLNVEVILSSRNSLPRELETLLLKQKLEVLGEEELAFNRKEINSFFYNKEKINYKTKDIYKRTEGWPLGVVALSISSHASQNNIKIPINNTSYLISNFIENEIFSEFSSIERQFMLETSILHTFSAETTNQITSFKNSKDILDNIVSKCNFLFELNNEEKWYRYHHMFKEFLEQKLKNKSLKLLNKLHKKAGEYYRSLGDIPMAIHHYSVNNREEILETIANNCSEVLLSLQPSSIIKLIDSLEDLGAFQNLRVCVCYSWALQYNVEPAKSAKFLVHLKELYESQQKYLTKKEQRKMQLELNAMSFPTNIVNKDFDKTLNCMKNMFFSPIKDPIAFKLNTLRQLYSNEYTLRDTAFGLYGRHDFLLELFEKVKKSKYKILFNYIKKIPSLSIVQAEVFYEINQLSDSTQYISKAVEESRKQKNMKDYLPAMLCLANIQKAKGNLKEVDESIKKCKETLKKNHDFLGLETLYAYEARIYILKNDLRNLKKWENTIDINAHDNLTYVTRHSLYKYLTLALCLIKTNRYVMARLLIDKTFDVLDKLDDLVYKSQALYLDALLMMYESNQESCLQRIEQFINIGNNNMYYRTYVDFGSELLELINLCENSNIVKSKFSKYINELKILTKEYSTKINNINLSITNTILSRREKDILFYICKNLTNQEIADELFVSLQTVKNHTSNIYKKLGISSRMQAINIAKEQLDF